jgi:uncharacterized membrane protein
MKLGTLTGLIGSTVLGGVFSMPTHAAQNAGGEIISFEVPAADTTPGDFNGTYPSAINDWGVITGYYEDASDEIHGFIRSLDGKYITFDAPGAAAVPGSNAGTNPSSINDLGEITGFYDDARGVTHGFLRTPDGKFKTIDVPGKGNNTVPIALNLEGAVVGYYLDSSSQFHAFLRSPDGQFTTFDGPGACDTGTSAGCYGSAAFAVNIFSVAAGAYEDNSGNFVHHGLVRDPRGRLVSFEAPGAGTAANQGTGCPGCAFGLNASGAIAGTYTDANNVSHGFLRSPNGTFLTFDNPASGTDAYQGTGCSADCPVSLNDWGAITGIYIDGDFVYHGYLRNPDGQFVTVDAADSVGTVFVNINELGAITGYYIDANNVYHGFLRIPSRFP